MATSGKIQGTTKNSSGSILNTYGTWIEWKRNGNPNITNNTSNVTVTVYLQRIDGYAGETAWDLESKPTVSFKVGGVAKTPTIYYIDTRNHKLCTVATWTGDVAHNSEGKLSLALSCDWVLGATYLYSGSISGTATLDTIPRASTISAVSGTTIGGEMKVTLATLASGYTHQMWYKVGNSDWYNIGTGILSTVSFNIDIATANQFPNSMSGNMQLCVRTFNGSTQIGTDYYKDVTVYVPSYTPTISNISLTGNNLLEGLYVQGKSTVTVKPTATTKYGASIKSYSVTVDGKTYTGETITSSVLGNGDKKVTVKVTDTRDRTATLDSSVFTVYPYAPPNITEFKVERKADGTTVVATIKGDVSPVNNKNPKSIWLHIGDDYKTTIYPTGYSFNETVTITDFEDDGTVNCKVWLNDYYTYREKEAILPTVAVTMDFHYSGKGVAFGKVAEEEKLFDVAWKTKITDTDWKTLMLKRIGATGAVTINFQNDIGSLGFIGMTGNAQNTLLRRWTSDGVTQYTVLDTGFVKDHIVAQGTDNNWIYEKWNNGVLKLYRNFSVSSTITSGWGALYSSPQITLPTFPITSGLTFVATPQVNLTWNGSYSVILDGATGVTTTKCGYVYMFRPDSVNTISGTIAIQVIGKWK